MSIGTEQVFVRSQSKSQSSTAEQKMNVELAAGSQRNLDDIENFSNVCRTCATITEFVMPIFEGEGLQNNLAEKIQKHLPIQVSCSDALPLVVCYQCASTLLAWHELVQCCVQADAALRTRLARAQPPVPPPAQHNATSDSPNVVSNIQDTKTATEENNDSEKEQQNKFKDIADFVVESLEPGRGDARPEATRACEYCRRDQPVALYEDHLVTAHAEILFRCDECHTYVYRKDFLVHMSLHAVEYAAISADKTKAGDAKAKVSSDANTSAEGHENEFSDHSDLENGFYPLPESVFEAFEDSQESQQLDDNRGSKTDALGTSKESNESVSSPLSPLLPDTNEKQKKPRPCPICTKVYTASSSYFYHMKYYHNRSKEHECDVCGRKFGTRATLAQHLTIHTGEKSFECKLCHKKFRSKASLYIHEQTHSGVKSYTCDECQRSFRWRTQLLRHMKRHSAEKAHVCSTCGRAFSIHCDLLRHARTHSNNKITCDKCGMKFRQSRYLKVHMHKKHAV